MKIDESVIDKVLDNKAAPGEARKVAGWFVTEEGRKYLSGLSTILDDWTVRWKSLQKRCRKMLDFLLFPA
mgnify:CR=1 FL=1